MKKEEQLLQALGNVKDSFVLEPSHYLGNPQRVLPQKKKKKWPVFTAAAAVAAVVLTGVLSLYPILSHNTAESAQKADQTELSEPETALSASVRIGGDTQRKLVFVTDGTQEEYRSIREVQIYDGQTLVQTIDEKNVPESAEYASDGLFINQAQAIGLPDLRDVNFDGYVDLGILAVSTYPKNVPYHYFLWNPQTEHFEYGFTLFGASALELDEVHQLLIEERTDNGQKSKAYYSFSTGTLRCVEADALEQAAERPQFHLEYDTGLLAMTENAQGIFLTPREYADNLPACEIQIEFLPGMLPYAAMEQSRREIALEQTAVHQDQQTLRYSVHITHGTAWDSQVENVLIVGAGSYGSFRLTSRYFVEAAEGWGITFPQICAGFTCPLAESPNPEAEKSIMDFAEGYFSGNQVAMLSAYYGDSKNLRDVYTMDASKVRIVSLNGLEELDERIEKDGFAPVSLTFLETEQSDSYNYLSMEIVKTQAGYRVSFYGLEK